SLAASRGTTPAIMAWQAPERAASSVITWPTSTQPDKPNLAAPAPALAKDPVTRHRPTAELLPANLPARDPAACGVVRSSGEFDQLAHRGAGFERSKAVVDLLELQSAGDQVVELQAALPPQRQ